MSTFMWFMYIIYLTLFIHYSQISYKSRLSAYVLYSVIYHSHIKIEVKREKSKRKDTVLHHTCTVVLQNICYSVKTSTLPYIKLLFNSFEINSLSLPLLQQTLSGLA